ncbi:MAG: DegV family protein, partial [Clostridia bacterium]|nr:DegV family protein [Clostridia bacterium]
VKLVGKAMGSKKANNLLNKLVQESGGIDFSMPFGAIYSGLNDALLQKYIADSAALWKNHADNVPIYPVGGTIGTHVGPGAIGVAFFKN